MASILDCRNNVKRYNVILMVSLLDCHNTVKRYNPILMASLLEQFTVHSNVLCFFYLGYESALGNRHSKIVDKYSDVIIEG